MESYNKSDIFGIFGAKVGSWRIPCMDVGLASGDLVAPEPATGRVGLIEAMRFGQHVLICLRFI